MSVRIYLGDFDKNIAFPGAKYYDGQNTALRIWQIVSEGKDHENQNDELQHTALSEFHHP